MVKCPAPVPQEDDCWLMMLPDLSEDTIGALGSSFILFLFFKINLFILFLAGLGFCCCVWSFFSCGERGLLFVAVHGLLIAVASLVVEHGL